MDAEAYRTSYQTGFASGTEMAALHTMDQDNATVACDTEWRLFVDDYDRGAWTQGCEAGLNRARQEALHL
jgi:hypothetical protein